jgi:hypothetical protein
MATNNATKMATAAPMCSLPQTVYTSKAITTRGAGGPTWGAFGGFYLGCIAMVVTFIVSLVSRREDQDFLRLGRGLPGRARMIDRL